MLKVNEDGSIPCPLRCGCQKIVLTQLAKRGWISNLIKDVEAALDNKMLSQSLSSGPYELCAAENIRPSAHTKCQRQAAQRSNSSDNFIYSPSALDMGQQALESFQKHWLRGEPVIVQDVLEKEKEPRWHPLTMWRNIQENNDIETVKAIDYLDCNQVLLYLSTNSFASSMSLGIATYFVLPSVLDSEISTFSG
jgi:lysine-specific demethylase 3